MARKIEELERDIKQLSPEQLRQFRAWYVEFDSDAWDQQIEQDAQNGKLDDLANQALKEHSAGKTKKLSGSFTMSNIRKPKIVSCCLAWVTFQEFSLFVIAKSKVKISFASFLREKQPRKKNGSMRVQNYEKRIRINENEVA